VLLAPVRNSSAVLLTSVKLSKTVRALLTGVNDTGEANLSASVSLSPAKYQIYQIKLRMFEKIEIVSRLVDRDQEDQFNERTRGEKT
jgi:hypothetical protein